MPSTSKTYTRNLRKGKFYTDIPIGSEGYNPIIIESYNSGNEILKIEEIWRGKKYTQTISGSKYTNQTIDYTVTHNLWEVTTYSG